MSSVLVLGSTGQIGAPFLTALRRAYPTLAITTYVRSFKQDEEFQRLDIQVVHGQFTETEKFVDECSKHNIIVDMVDSYSVDISKAILRGMKVHADRKATLLHLSGAGAFSDRATSGNLSVKGKIWNDSDENDIRSIPAQAGNGAVDDIILKAADKGDINAYIVCPVAVHGKGQSEITSTSNGVFMRGMIANITSLGYSPYIGDGTAVFGQVHVDDVVSLLLLVFKKALHPDAEEGAYQRYYIAAGVTREHKALATIFAEEMYRQGKIASPEPKQVRPEEAGSMARILGANFLVGDENSKALGYSPKGADLSETLRSVEIN